MPYMDFPEGQKGQEARKQFWLSADGLTLVAQWRREGIPFEEIAARYIGVSSQTLWRWTKCSEDLAKVLRVSQDCTNATVEQALLKRALGYDYDEETWELVEGALMRTKVVSKHVPPDVKACLSWLFSRRSDRWRSIQEPLDESAKDVETAKKILVAIKEVADGNPDTTQSETD